MGLSLRGQTSGAVDINAPAVAGDNTITLPDGNGSANQFYKNSTTAGIVTHSSMVELANGRVGVGTTNPSQVLHVDQGNVLINNNGTASSLIIKTDTNRDANVYFGDSDSESRGRIRYNNSADYLSIFTAGDERVRITSTGGVGVNTTTVSAGVNVAVGGTIRVQDSTDATQYLTITHQGIDFQNTGAGSSDTATAHLLDDYEQGTWTATLVTGGNGVNSGSTRYVKLGRKVTVWGRISGLDTPAASNVTIRLPFAASQGVGDTPEGVGAAMINNVNLDNGASKTYLVCYVGGNDMAFYQCGDNVGWDPLQGTEMTGSGSIIFTLNYYTEA